MLRSLAAASLVVCLGVQTAPAQDLEAICRRVGQPVMGSWSEFKMVGGRNDGATVRLSIVGSQMVHGARYYWLEISTHGLMMGPERGAGGTPTVIDKMLVQGIGPAQGTPEAVVMKFGSAPAMELPLNRSRASMNPGTSVLARCREGKVVGWERVTVPGGTFRSLHVQDRSGENDLWVDPDLPFALIKGSNVGGDHAQMVLVAHGHGATSQIRERPQPWNPQLFMQMMQGGGGEH